MAAGGREIRMARADAMTAESIATEGQEPIGTPYQLAALDDHTVAYSDLQSEAIRMLQFDPAELAHGPLVSPAAGKMHRPVAGTLTLLAGPRADDATSGGFADGDAALLDAPMGIAATAAGDLVFADAGNRRIRVVRGIERGRGLLEDGALPPPRGADRAYRILYVGTSIVWWDTSWPASIPGTIERDLRTMRPLGQRDIEIFPARLIGADAAAYESYLQEVADSATVDAVVLNVNAPAASDSTGSWVPPTAAALRTIHEELSRAHLPLVVVAMPMPLDLEPAEQTWRKVVEDALAPLPADDEARWLEAFRDAQVSSVDLFPVFRNDLRSAGHRPLYGSDEAHLTPHGRAVAAHAIAAGLERLRPWGGAPR
jgi:SGNH hydrolase-like domain, acetyltransferase AlgX